MLGRAMDFFFGDVGNVAGERRVVQDDGNGGGRKSAALGDIADGNDGRLRLFAGGLGRRAGFRRGGGEYAAGRTPNPCVRCNQAIKFGVLLDRARAAGATHVATGHYARIGRRGSAASLHRGHTVGKDQAYALHRLDQGQLLASVFPLGSETSKDAVRRTAAELGLMTAAKPDSQELCFVDGPLRADLERRLDGRFRPGAMVDQEGTVVGEHRGVPFYTVGQRSGLGLSPSRPDAAPVFVLAVDASANTVTVGPRSALECDTVRLADVHWIAEAAAPGAPLQLPLP